MAAKARSKTAARSPKKKKSASKAAKPASKKKAVPKKTTAKSKKAAPKKATRKETAAKKPGRAGRGGAAKKKVSTKAKTARRPAARKPAPKKKKATKPARKSVRKAAPAKAAARKPSPKKAPARKAAPPKPAGKAPRKQAAPAGRPARTPPAKPVRPTVPGQPGVASEVTVPPKAVRVRPSKARAETARPTGPKDGQKAAAAADETGTAQATGAPAPKRKTARGATLVPPRKPGRRRRPRFDEDDVEDEGEDESYDEGEDEGLEMFDEDGERFGVAPSIPLVRRRKKKKKARAGTAGRQGRRQKLKRRRRSGRVRPSPPLQQTDPLGAYLAGEMVPCPVGCGGFSEVVRVGSLESGAGEVWFECLSCAQRRAFEIPKATKAENAAVSETAETEGREPLCPRHKRPVQLRRRGRQFVCPACGVVFL